MMLTSGPRPGDRARCTALGLSAYLIKPIKQSDLLDTIVAVLPGGRAKAVPRPPRARPARAGALRVLVAEDNAVNQQVAVGMLERDGHRAAVAANGREALALLEREVFDLILMDVQMPEMDGLETTAAIREREKVTGAHVPIVAVTAHAMKGDAERCLAAGMDAYLPKPLEPRQLRAILARLGGGTVPPGAVEVAPERTTLDEARVLDRVGGDRRVLRRLVRLFLADSRTLEARIRRAIGEGSAPDLRAAAHALKGSVSNFAAPAATAAAAQLQRIGGSGDLGEAPAAFARLDQELALVRKHLSTIVSGRRPQARPPRRAR
jgi:CheY-like chemotaxis protein